MSQGLSLNDLDESYGNQEARRYDRKPAFELQIGISFHQRYSYLLEVNAAAGD